MSEFKVGDYIIAYNVLISQIVPDPHNNGDYHHLKLLDGVTGGAYLPSMKPLNFFNLLHSEVCKDNQNDKFIREYLTSLVE